MFSKIYQWIKQETVLVIAALCGILTMFFVPPSSEYIQYIDLKVLCLLFCLMTVVAGFQSCGVFHWLAIQLLKKSKNGRILSVVLVMLPFFTSMLVTNDVALLTFVPFTILLLDQIACPKALVPVLVLQTIAANLGSMATPVGNPQNLFLYAAYNLSAGDFFSAVLPLTLFSFICLVASSLPVLPSKLPKIAMGRQSIANPHRLLIYGILFVLCLLTVFRIVHFAITTLAVIVIVFFTDKQLLKKPDYALLATFVCFFIVSGNLGKIESIRQGLNVLLQKNTLITATLTSQVISNVPAAVLLSGFTESWNPLLQGVNIGGLGTPVASLASLITLKLYTSAKDANLSHFLLIFTLYNVIGLVLLLLLTMLF